jgi:hypothetical protein
LFLRNRHAWIAEDHRFGAAMRKACCRILPGHSACETKALFSGHVAGHADATDRNPTGGVVNDNNGFQADARPMNVNDSRWTEIVCKLKAVLHPYSLHGPRSQSLPASEVPR